MSKDNHLFCTKIKENSVFLLVSVFNVEIKIFFLLAPLTHFVFYFLLIVFINFFPNLEMYIFDKKSCYLTCQFFIEWLLETRYTFF